MKTKDFNHGKRLSAVLMALLLGCVLGMQAQTDYYVNVGGIEVTSDNCNLINSEPGATDFEMHWRPMADNSISAISSQLPSTLLCTLPYKLLYAPSLRHAVGVGSFQPIFVGSN